MIADAFVGCGGNAIQFALQGMHVLGFDLDSRRLRQAKHNTAVYGVAALCQFVQADWTKFAAGLAQSGKPRSRVRVGGSSCKEAVVRGW